jgi:signal transduction histidine kinase
VAALEWLASDTRRRSGLDVRIRVEPAELEVSQDVARGLFRIVQESLTNAIRHAGARHVQVALTLAGDGIVVTVADDGVGLPPAAARPHSLGILSMRARATALGCTFELSSPPGGGLLVTARLPSLLAAARASGAA